MDHLRLNRDNRFETLLSASFTIIAGSAGQFVVKLVLQLANPGLHLQAPQPQTDTVVAVNSFCYCWPADLSVLSAL